MPLRYDLKGRRFGRLTVIDRAPDRKKQIFWHTVCDCGEKRINNSVVLRKGEAYSCGCLARELAPFRNVTHGETKTNLYGRWRKMIQRCENPNRQDFPRYGGRGIKVCQRWREDFLNFKADMGPPPTPSHSLDRYPNNDGDYEPSNCRWATVKEQNNNRSSNRLVEYKGKMLTLSEVRSLTGIAKHLLQNRLDAGWSVEAAIETPSRYEIPRDPRLDEIKRLKQRAYDRTRSPTNRASRRNAIEVEEARLAQLLSDIRTERDLRPVPALRLVR